MKKLIITILKIVFFFVVWVFLLQVTKLDLFKAPPFFADTAARNELWIQGLAFFAMLVTTVIFVALIDWGRVVPKLTLAPGRDALYGVIIGAIWIFGTIGLLMLTSSIEFQKWETVPHLLIWIIAILINSITIEYVFRGYPFTVLLQNFGPVVAITVTSIVYVAVQSEVLNNGLTSILFVLTASILLSLMRYHTKGLLAPIIASFIWNFIGGLIVGGVSIGAQYPNMLTGDLHGLAIVSGGDAKFEGSAITLIVLINLIYLVVLLMKDSKYSRGKGSNRKKV